MTWSGCSASPLAVSQAELHELGDRQHAAAQVEVALECVGRILDAVACKVDEVGRVDAIGHSLDCGFSGDGLDGVSKLLRSCGSLDTPELCPDAP
jgi:hypothetical protein